MSWLRRLWRGRPREQEPEAPDESGPAGEERASPGIAALFEGLRADGDHAVLDLGPGGAAHLRIFQRYSRLIRFANLLPKPPRGAAFRAALASVPPHPERPYDVVLAWNLLDWLNPDERRALIARIDELTDRGARLYAQVDTSGEGTIRPLRISLVDLRHVSEEVVGPPERARPQLLPAQVEQLFRPFEVVRAFTLRGGRREYVGVKGGEAAFRS